MKRPVVVALNPSIDAEWCVDGVRWEEKNNVLSERRWAGGKGVNVARWLKHLGENPQLILPLGGTSGRELAALLRAEKISATIIRLGVSPDTRSGLPLPFGRGEGRGEGNSATRVNLIVSTKTQGQLRFNPLGPELSKREWQTMLTRVRAALRHASCLILSGSLPRGVPVNAYAQLIRLARAAKVSALLDCDGPALAAAIRAKPFLVKPNEHELAQWSTGLRPGVVGQASCLSGGRSEISQAARQLSSVTQHWVLVSRGAKPALLVNATANQTLAARPPRVNPRNTVGAGDALLAAVAQQLIHNAPPSAWLRAGLATGSAATQLQAGGLPVR